jgi:phosphoribosylglycinamide formyltransferase-1
MANLAVFASGTGTNFEAIAERFENSRHKVICLICNKKDTPVLGKAERCGIPAFFIDYNGKTREEAEKDALSILDSYKTDLVALAGFMKLLSPNFIDRYPGRIINIHPSLLPRYSGTDGIRKSYLSGDTELGITIHGVDYGLDTGPIIMQKSFNRSGDETPAEIEERIHELEHLYYPAALIDILDSINQIINNDGLDTAGGSI